MKFVADWFLGRTTLFCFGFFVCGNVMHAFHKLDAVYITYMATLMGFVLGHSYKQDVVKPSSNP